MKTREDLLREAREQVPEMTARQAHAYLNGGGNPVLLDVREQDEWERGHIEGAVHIPRGRLEQEVEASLPDKSREVLVYCAVGVRSLLAGETLKALGYRRAISMQGGFSDWTEAGLPVCQPPMPQEEAKGDPALLQAEIEHLESVLAQKKGRLERLKVE